MQAPIIETLDVLKKVHDAYELVEDMDPGPHRDKLLMQANSAFSAVLLYLRQANSAVQQKHYDSIRGLYEALNQLTGK